MSQMDVSSTSKQIAGKVVSTLAQPSPGSMAIHFTDGTALVIRERGQGASVTLTVADGSGRRKAAGSQPTGRQMEYLGFIKQYLDRYGVSPAESDIQARFLISAPSVNQMMRTLERRGFIARNRDRLGHTVPRSIRVTWGD